MDIRMLRTEADHAWALAEFERYFDGEPQPGSEEGDRFELLGLLIREYEEKAWAVEPGDPVDVLRFAIEDMGRSQAELAQILGSRSRASEILNRKRALTLDMVHKISREWRIPVEALVRPYSLAPASESNEAGRREAARQPRRRRSQRA
jgi:HTH-type transcriptional regulator/antitoxin HigA